MIEPDARPPIWVGHVVMQSSRLAASADFMRALGMRPVFEGPAVAIFELRGGTHLIVTAKADALPGDAPFDLMVEDLRATHARFAAAGLEPTPIEAVARIDHEFFRVKEPAGNVITIYSDHAGGRPV